MVVVVVEWAVVLLAVVVLAAAARHLQRHLELLHLAAQPHVVERLDLVRREAAGLARDHDELAVVEVRDAPRPTRGGTRRRQSRG